MPKAAPTDDLAEFRELSRNPKRHTCGIVKAAAQLDPDDATRLQKALAAPLDEIGHAGIQAWLKKRGVVCATDTIGRHRRGRCRCGDE